MKCEGIKVSHVDQVGDALKEALKMQKEGKTCLVECMTTKELDLPFRRDAMKMPVRNLEKYKAYEASSEDVWG